MSIRPDYRKSRRNSLLPLGEGGPIGSDEGAPGRERPAIFLADIVLRQPLICAIQNGRLIEFRSAEPHCDTENEKRIFLFQSAITH